MEFFKEDKLNGLEAKEYAQQIAFAPIVFQASLSLRNLGVLRVIEDSNRTGLTFDEIHSKVNLSVYGLRVLLEAGLGIRLMTFKDEKYKLTKAGYFILNDNMTIANMDFVQDVCYEGMFQLEKSIVDGKPEGLKTFGSWNTLYEALSTMPTKAQASWLAFDHYYSSDSFPKVLPHVFKNNPKRILDIGGNTGKWTLKCTEYSPTVLMGIVDLPGQVNMAKETMKKAGVEDRVTFHEINLLEKGSQLPKGYDVIWMSQFLDCFSEAEIVSILERCHSAIDENGEVFILEPFWDTQKYEVSAFCLQMTSLYFTNIANGNSQMYHSGLFSSLVEKAGLKIVERIDSIGVSNSLLRCKK